MINGDKQSPNHFTDVEARRNAFTSLASLIVCVASQIQTCKLVFCKPILLSD